MINVPVHSHHKDSSLFQHQQRSCYGQHFHRHGSAEAVFYDVELPQKQRHRDKIIIRCTFSMMLVKKKREKKERKTKEEEEEEDEEEEEEERKKQRKVEGGFTFRALLLPTRSAPSERFGY